MIEITKKNGYFVIRRNNTEKVLEPGDIFEIVDDINKMSPESQLALSVFIADTFGLPVTTPVIRKAGNKVVVVSETDTYMIAKEDGRIAVYVVKTAEIAGGEAVCIVPFKGADEVIKDIESTVKLLFGRVDQSFVIVNSSGTNISLSFTIQQRSFTADIKLWDSRARIVIHPRLPRMYCAVNYYLKKQYPDIVKDSTVSTVLYAEGNLRRIVPVVRKALLILRKVQTVWSDDPDELLERISDVLRKKGFPIIANVLTPVEITSLYFYTYCKKDIVLQNYMTVYEDIVRKHVGTNKEYIKLAGLLCREAGEQARKLLTS